MLRTSLTPARYTVRVRVMKGRCRRGDGVDPFVSARSEQLGVKAVCDPTDVELLDVKIAYLVTPTPV